MNETQRMESLETVETLETVSAGELLTNPDHINFIFEPVAGEIMSAQQEGKSVIINTRYASHRFGTGRKVRVIRTRYYIPRDSVSGHREVSEIRLSECRTGCKVFSCTCGSEHTFHNQIYGCAVGGRIEVCGA